MRPLRLLRASLTVAALVAALTVSAGASAATLKANLKGVQITSLTPDTSEAALDADLARAHELGAAVVRSDVHWSWIEPAAQGQMDAAYLARADHLFTEAHRLGIKVFLTILGTPCWTTTAPSPDCSTPAGRRLAQAYPPADDAAFARAAAFVAARWQGDLAALEVWNEPDQRNELYWKGPDKVVRYANLLKAAYPAIKAAAPSVVVAGAGIVGSNGLFLKALYAKGIQGSYDVLSVHYYDLVLLSLGQIRAVRRAAGDAKPMWLGEFGWTSCLSASRKTQGQHTCVSRSTQARNTIDVLAALRGRSDVAGAILYTLRDTGQYDFGVLDHGGNRKPLFAAVAQAYHGHLGPARRISYRLRVRNGRVVATGSGPAGDAYVIEAKINGRLRWRAAFRGDRDNRFAVNLPAQLGRSNITVSIRRYSVAGRPVVRHL